MKKYWDNDEEMTDSECQLVSALHSAQFSCAFRENASTVAFQIAAGSTGNLARGITAGLSTLGGRHAPIEEIHGFLTEPEGTLPDVVPGWGSAFVKGKHDPAFDDVRDWILALNIDLHGRIHRTTLALEARGQHIFPNPGCWTAATAITIGMPAYLAPILFVMPRIEAWGMLFHEMKKL